MHVDLFAYGTFRELEVGLDAESLSWMNIHGWDTRATCVGRTGDWRIDDYALFGGVNLSVPAVTSMHGQSVTGDVYRLTLDGFAQVLQYEGWPQLYQYETVVARSKSSPLVTAEVVIFTTPSAPGFGPLSTTGDWLDPQPMKESQCESTVRTRS